MMKNGAKRRLKRFIVAQIVEIGAEGIENEETRGI